MKKPRRISIGLLCLAWVMGSTAWASTPPSADEVVRRAEHTAYYLGRDGRASVSMLIKDAQGRERRRRMTILRWDAPGAEAGSEPPDLAQKYYVYIRYPQDLKSTVLLVWKRRDGADDRWLYLPGLDLAKRIAAGDKRTSFLGSDFCYEDISGRSADLDTHELVEVTDDYYVVKNVPKDPATVEFSAYTVWIHRQTYLPVKVEFLDKQGEPARIYEVLKVDTVQGHPTVTRARMRDLALGQETLLRFSRVRYDTGLDEEVFSERYLRSPPRAALR